MEELQHAHRLLIVANMAIVSREDPVWVSLDVQKVVEYCNGDLW